jgi:hypothetical protein
LLSQRVQQRLEPPANYSFVRPHSVVGSERLGHFQREHGQGLGRYHLGIFFPRAIWRPKKAQKSSGSATSDISPAFFLRETTPIYCGTVGYEPTGLGLLFAKPFAELKGSGGRDRPPGESPFPWAVVLTELA